jgi:hypothetical protein
MLLLLAAGLAGCHKKSGASSQAQSAGKSEIKGVPDFELGATLGDNFDLKPQADGSLLYYDANYTNIPPFANLSVFTTPGRVIYTVQLRSLPGVDREACGTLSASLAAEYGNRQDQNDRLYRTTTFKHGDRSATLRLAYTDDTAELTYSLSQTNH